MKMRTEFIFLCQLGKDIRRHTFGFDRSQPDALDPVDLTYGMDRVTDAKFRILSERGEVDADQYDFFESVIR